MTGFSSIKRILFVLWLLAFPLLPVFWYYPVIDFRDRVITLLIADFLAMGAICVFWRNKFALSMLLVVYAGVAAFLSWPSALPWDRDGLRYTYGRALESYEGSRYVWGGEGCYGIDCSGLVRKGMEDALVEQGILICNPALVREGIALYWNDTTAKVIGEGYEGRTKSVLLCKSLNSLNYALVQPGDMAVTIRGEHIMAYLGNKTWIAADPGEGQVTKFKIPEEKNGYFSQPMKIVRWTVLMK